MFFSDINHLLLLLYHISIFQPKLGSKRQQNWFIIDFPLCYWEIAKMGYLLPSNIDRQNMQLALTDTLKAFGKFKNNQKGV